MKRIYILSALLIITLCACSQSDSVPEDKPAEAPPDVVVEEEPYSGGFTKEQRISDAQTIIGLFERNYAPREWKKEFLNISFEDHSKSFVVAAAEDISDEEFYGFIGKYLTGFQDAHIGFYFPSSAAATLPFIVDDIEEHLVVVETKHDAPEDIKVGSELVAIDGVPAETILEEILNYVGTGNPAASRRFAARQITLRRQYSLPELPDEATVTVTFRSFADGTAKDVTLEWERTGNEFAEYNDAGIDISANVKSDTIEAKDDNPFYSKMRIFPSLEKRSFSLLGNTEPFFPMGDDFMERKDGPLYSGIFIVENKRIAYIRIPDFYSNPYESIAQMEEDIRYYEDTTDALILDETANPGGDWCYATTLASFFYDETFKDLNDHWRANRDTLTHIEMMVEHPEWFDLTEDEIKQAEEIAADIRDAMKTGRLLSKPYPICAWDGNLEPYKDDEGNKIIYTKPVLLLMNELSVSCGDLFPALMKDNGRATLFGATTMGGGGAVDGRRAIGYSESNISFTISLVLRNKTTETSDGLQTGFIENVGVKPDIEYQITLDDFMSGYELYRNSVIQAALSLVDNEAEKEATDEE